MRLSILRSTIYEATMVSQEMSDFIESTLDELERILDDVGPHNWLKSSDLHGGFVYGGEVRSNVKVKSSLPQFTTRILNVYLEVSYDKDFKSSNGGIKNGEFEYKIYIIVPIKYFGNFKKYKYDLRDTVVHEVVHAFDPKYWYHRSGAGVSSVSEVDENLESIAYTMASSAKGNVNRLRSLLNRGNLRADYSYIVDDPKLWGKFVNRALEIWRNYFSN